MPPAAAPAMLNGRVAHGYDGPRRGVNAPRRHRTMKLKKPDIGSLAAPYAQMKSSTSFMLPLLIHHVKVLKCRLLPVDGIHIFPQHSNPLHRDIQLIAAINGLIKCRRQ